MKKCCWLYANERINTYSACFIGKTIDELVKDFNDDCGLRELTQDRAYYHEALLHAFEEKGIDISAISDGENIDFSHHIAYDREKHALIIQE